MDIIYLDDYINIYLKDKDNIYVIKPYKNTLRNGIIINNYKFFKRLKKELDNIGIKNSIFLSSIKVITNNYYTDIDKEIIKEVLEELNYKNIYFIHELEYLKINKNRVYINCNYTYYYILYTNYYGNINLDIYNNKDLFIYVINKYINKDIFIYGKNSKEFMNLLDIYKIDYYVFEESDNLIMKNILISKN